MKKTILATMVLIGIVTSLNAYDLLGISDKCNRGDKHACYTMGSMYLHGNGVERDLNKAKKYHSWLCNSRDPNYAKTCQTLQIIQVMLNSGVATSTPAQKEHTQSNSKNQKEHMTTKRLSEFNMITRYPANILTEKISKDNGVYLSNRDVSVEVSSYARPAIGTNSINKIYRETINEKNTNPYIEITYKRQKKNWYILSGYNKAAQMIFYEKKYLLNGVISGFSISYPIKDKEKYNQLIKIIVKGFKPISNISKVFTKNSSGIYILEDEYIDSEIVEMALLKNGEGCTLDIDSSGIISRTDCIQLTNSRNIKVICTKRKTLCKTVNELTEYIYTN